jgi:hypothetical protein
LNDELGAVVICAVSGWKRSYLPEELVYRELDWFPKRSIWNRLGFHHRDLRNYGKRFDPSADRSWMVPCWFHILISAAIPGSQLLKLYNRRRRRFIGTSCEFCDYDLRATPNRCPECGRIARHRSALSH